MKPLYFFCLLSLMFSNCKTEIVKQKEYLYVGTFQDRGSQGIYVYEFDRDSVKFSLKQTLPEIVRPGFLEIYPDGRYLYSINRVRNAEGIQKEMVSSFAINSEDGILSLINQVPAHGTGACHVNIDKAGKYLYISFYDSGSLTVFAINPDGSIGDTIQTIKYEGSSVNERRQDKAHVHSVLFSPDNAFVYIADLGTDKVMICSIDHTTGKLLPASPPSVSVIPGSGPRHMTFHPEKPYVYLAEELSSSTSLFYQDQVTGNLTSMQTISTLPEDFTDQNTNADIHIDPSGKFLFVSNRGHNSLATYSINKENGELRIVDYPSTMGEHPRNFLIEPKGEFILVANRDTDNVAVFRLDKATGLLEYTGISLDIPVPVCLKWLKI